MGLACCLKSVIQERVPLIWPDFWSVLNNILVMSWNFPARAKLNWKSSGASRAELGHSANFPFWVEVETRTMAQASLVRTHHYDICDKLFNWKIHFLSRLYPNVHYQMSALIHGLDCVFWYVRPKFFAYGHAYLHIWWTIWTGYFVNCTISCFISKEFSLLVSWSLTRRKPHEFLCVLKLGFVICYDQILDVVKKCDMF